jgi:small subunit ribosomal protein SAe
MSAAAFENVPAIMQPKEEDIQMMLSAGVHTGTRNSDSMMTDYIWRRRNDGVHIINIGKTWEKLMLAARVIVAIENPEDVIAISARPYGMRATLKYGEYCQLCISAQLLLLRRLVSLTRFHHLFYS